MRGALLVEVIVPVLTRIVVSCRMPESNAFRSNTIIQLYVTFAVCGDGNRCMPCLLVKRFLVSIALGHFFVISAAKTSIQLSATIESV